MNSSNNVFNGGFFTVDLITTDFLFHKLHFHVVYPKQFQKKTPSSTKKIFHQSLLSRINTFFKTKVLLYVLARAFYFYGHFKMVDGYRYHLVANNHDTMDLLVSW